MAQDEIVDAGVIHDMRNLLTAITAHSAILQGHVPEEHRQTVTELSSSVIHLEQLVKSLEGERSGISSGALVGVIKTAREVTVLLSSAFPQVEFVLPEDGREIPARMPSSDLFRILLNLLGNAAEAAGSGESNPPLVRLAVNPDEGIVSVSDSGPGFGGMDINTAAAPFVSKGNPERHQGLGLFVVKSLVERRGGQLRVTRENQMNTVLCEFPPALFTQRACRNIAPPATPDLKD